MADYQLNGQNQFINYAPAGSFAESDYGNPAPNAGSSLGLFLNGGTGSDNKPYPKVDMSLWDQATMCGTCHVGGVTYEEDRLGNRLPLKTLQDWGALFGQQTPLNINPITSTVWENFNADGSQASYVVMTPWAYPVYLNNGGKPDGSTDNGAMIVTPWEPDPVGQPGVTVGGGWGPADMSMPNPNAPADANKAYPIYAGQVMMPNVKEMDCLFCHLQGYDNISASVMTQAGALSMGPTAGAGLFDMTPISPTYMGYNPGTGKVAFTKVSDAMQLPPVFANFSAHEMVTLTSAVTGKILAKPDSDNCMLCHATKTLTNLPEMFGTTGTGNGFLSSAPMIYDPAEGIGPLSKRMTAFDINAMFSAFGIGTEPTITGANAMSYLMPGLPWPQAMGKTPFNFSSWNDPNGFIGGGNDVSLGMAAMGPLYYYNVDASGNKVLDQNMLKRSTMPFPRAEWFKRGDAWQAGQDVHTSFGCAGCHFTGDSTNKNQCDPGRGFDMMSGIEDGVPPLKNRDLTAEVNGLPNGTDSNGTDPNMPAQHDTRNTVKRCEFCHLTGKDVNGNAIDSFGAPNPNTAHQNAGLMANIVQVVDTYTLHGTFGGKGTPRETNFTSTDNGTDQPGGTILGKGNHLDVMDCTVCHVQKVSMAVRSLDATSGMRFPAIVGTEPMKGMFGLFEDPTGMGNTPTSGFGGKLQEWKPLHEWQAMGNMDLPLTNSLQPGPHQNNSNPDFKFRRKIYLANPISAILWNNEGTGIDANGDGARGGLLKNNVDGTDATAAPGLAKYRDIFTNDLLDENNTAGYGLPIFDPWMQRDLKAGFNFGPSALSVISVGFGSGAYASIYDNNGLFNSTTPQYASVWSGAYVFTEPDQIAAYKASRGASWDNTVLTLVGAPFTLTHGVKPTATYAQGKNCADCHATGAGFFNGKFDMLGPAVPATQTYNPTQYVVTDSDGNVTLDANGDPVRAAGTPGVTIPGDNGNLLYRPIEPIRIKANPGDLRGYLETHNKLGQPREANFIQYNYNNTGYDVASTIDRFEALYPEEDGAIYYKLGDVNPDGSLNGTPTAMDGQEYADYMETLSNGAAFGIGIAPVASITDITDADPVRLGVQVVRTAGTATVALSAGTAQAGAPDSLCTFTWSFSDGTTSVTGKTASVDFTSLGSKTITLTVKDEEGKLGVTTTTVEVVDPGIGIAATAAPVTKLVSEPFSFTNLPATTNKVKIAWGDGTSQYVTVVPPATTANVNHKYGTAGSKIIKVYAYYGSAQIGYTQATISVVNP